MHRKVKGLLSLVITVAMVTATVTPASAEELSAMQQPAEQQPIVEIIEPETAPADEQIAEEAEPVQQPAEPEPVIPTVTEAELVPAPVEEEPVTLDTEAPALVEKQIAAEPETQPVLEKQDAVAEPALTADTSTEYLYDNLTADQKQFLVQSLTIGVTPDAENLDTLSGQLRTALMAQREGDLKFYTLSGWNIWSVDENGMPQEVVIRAEASLLKTVATKENFLKAAYMVNNGTGTSPVVICKQPILEAIWKCWNYVIPVYDKDGNASASTFMINAENYSSAEFPNMETGADAWKLVYDGTEYPLNAASDVWTVIQTVGTGFTESKAKLQAVVSPTVLQEGSAEFVQPDWTEGQSKPEPVVSSATNGIENITYFYKAQGADDSAYTTTVPDKAGVYTAAAVFAATAEYQEVIKTADFTIFPAQVILQEGTAEFTQPGWQEGQPKPDPVVSSATNGIENITYYYKEAGADDSTYTTTVPDKAGNYTAKAVFAATELYLEVTVTSDFEILPKAPVVEADKTAPVISGVTNGQVHYGDQTVTVTDENLKTVTVNGEAAAISDNRADITLKPSEEAYKIIAEDAAGNKTEYSVEVWETWVRDGIKTNGKKMLRRARMYKLGSGKWTVDGDTTVYSSGTFYVKNDGEYDFTKK